MRGEKITADRLATFSDAVFAVIVTIMVLELKAPDEAAFSALEPLWPTVISYVVSYLFIAIIWINHHYLIRFAGAPSLRLIWINFVHLFMVSLLPFATAWVARTRLASSPVVFYAGLFVYIDIAYNVFERKILAGGEAMQLSASTRVWRGADHWLCSRASRPLCWLHWRAAPRLRSDMRRPGPPRAARRCGQSVLTSCETRTGATVRIDCARNRNLGQSYALPL
jgi:uncharacterized membrane protein